MKSLIDKINEQYYNIDVQWLNDDKPCKTISGNKVKIIDIDIKEVPNKIHGIVYDDSYQVNYTWEDDGTCIACTDKYGTPRKPTYEDTLIKDI